MSEVVRYTKYHLSNKNVTNVRAQVLRRYNQLKYDLELKRQHDEEDCHDKSWLMGAIFGLSEALDILDGNLALGGINYVE